MSNNIAMVDDAPPAPPLSIARGEDAPRGQLVLGRDGDDVR